MILTKTNTDIFGKTVPDETPIEHLGGRLYLIRGRVFYKCGEEGVGGTYGGFLDGKQANIGVHFDLISKSYLLWEIKIGRANSDVGKKVIKLITYDMRKIAVEDL